MKTDIIDRLYESTGVKPKQRNDKQFLLYLKDIGFPSLAKLFIITKDWDKPKKKNVKREI